MIKRFEIRRLMRGVAAVAVGGLLVLAPRADAMRVAPMVAELSTTGIGSAARIEVGNVGGAALPFETTITRIEMGPDDSIVETPADEDFLVFPPQGLVPVGGRQVVRVQWVGAPDIDTSRAYYLTVRQLPVATETDGPVEQDRMAAAVKLLYVMKPLIVVAPPGAVPDVRVETVRAVSVEAPMPDIDPELAGAPEDQVAPPSEPGVEVTVTNVGKRYALMSGATWNIEGTGTDGQPLTLRLDSGAISRSVGVGYLAPAGGKRTFKVPTGQAFDPNRTITVRFTQ